MALPVGHALVGLAISKRTKNNPLAAILLANLMDIDFVFGLLADGNALSQHRSPFTRNPLLAVAVGLSFWLWYRHRKTKYATRLAFGAGLITLSHWIIDYLIVMPYRYDITKGTNGLFDFLFAHIISSEFLYNAILDLAIYGSLYILVVRFIFKQKLI